MSERTRTILIVVTAVAALASGGLLIARNIGGESPAGEETRLRDVIDSDTGVILRDYPIKHGSSFPWKNPKTGKNSLYPAERCFWTRDGKAKTEPTLVFVKAYANSDEETLCPDCGRKVVPHNPTPPDSLMLDAAEQVQRKR
ncbi:MAG: hypothetical protein H7Y88_08250 [Phycisphaerales bacterium]|nr:hypothetical protein [Phycisphaerales bacterium]